MLKINENKTLKELREKGFYILGYSFYYDIDSLVRIVFSANCNDEDYLKYIGNEYSALVEKNKYKKDIEKVLKELKEDNFVLESR